MTIRIFERDKLIHKTQSEYVPRYSDIILVNGIEHQVVDSRVMYNDGEECYAVITVS